MASTGDPAKEQIITEEDAKKSLGLESTEGGFAGSGASGVRARE